MVKVIGNITHEFSARSAIQHQVSFERKSNYVHKTNQIETFLVEQRFGNWGCVKAVYVQIKSFLIQKCMLDPGNWPKWDRGSRLWLIGYLFYHTAMAAYNRICKRIR
jgi:hypothetical protein